MRPAWKRREQARRDFDAEQARFDAAFGELADDDLEQLKAPSTTCVKCGGALGPGRVHTVAGPVCYGCVKEENQHALVR